MKYWHQLTEYMPIKDLERFIEPFKRYNELNQTEVKTTKEGSVIFTTGKYQSNNMRRFYGGEV